MLVLSAARQNSGNKKKRICRNHYMGQSCCVAGIVALTLTFRPYPWQREPTIFPNLKMGDYKQLWSKLQCAEHIKNL